MLTLCYWQETTWLQVGEVMYLLLVLYCSCGFIPFTKVASELASNIVSLNHMLTSLCSLSLFQQMNTGFSEGFSWLNKGSSEHSLMMPRY